MPAGVPGTTVGGGVELDPPLLAQPVSIEPAAIGISKRHAVTARRIARMRNAGLLAAARSVAMQNSKATAVSCASGRLAGGIEFGSDCGAIMLAAVVETETA